MLSNIMNLYSLRYFLFYFHLRWLRAQSGFRDMWLQKWSAVGQQLSQKENPVPAKGLVLSLSVTCGHSPTHPLVSGQNELMGQAWGACPARIRSGDSALLRRVNWGWPGSFSKWYVWDHQKFVTWSCWEIFCLSLALLKIIDFQFPI